MGREYKKNQVVVDIAGYVHYIRGVKKIGKTTLFKDILLEEYGSTDAGLLLSLGNENGFKALPDVIYEVVEDWATLTEIVDDLVENKQDNNFKMICFDTVDELTVLAENEVIRLDRKKTGEKHPFNACFGGYGEPRKQLINLINTVITKLQRAGYGIFEIGHTKLRDIKEKNGDAYQLLTSNLSADYDSIFADKADVVMLGENVRDIEDKHITGMKRIMHFRSNGFVDAGSRFDDIADSCDWSAENYIKTVKDAIKKKLGVTDEKTYNKMVKAERKDKENNYEINKDKINADPDKLADFIKNFLKTSDNAEKKKEVATKIKELNLDVKDLSGNDVEKLFLLVKLIKA